jgi:hypothetical protein
LYACVSSKEQEKEGYSIPEQVKLIREYAVRCGMIIAREFEDVETAMSGKSILRAGLLNCSTASSLMMKCWIG